MVGQVKSIVWKHTTGERTDPTWGFSLSAEPEPEAEPEAEPDAEPDAEPEPEPEPDASWEKCSESKAP